MSRRDALVRTNLHRWVALLASLLVAAACGCGGGNGSTGYTLQDASTGSDVTTVSKDSGFGLGHDSGKGCGLVTCKSKNANCGPISDGCGNIIQCGTCKAPETCGGGGPSRCGIEDGSSCTPKTCKELGFNCGPQGDGCGGTVKCGSCSGGETCGGGGKPGVCGSSDGGPCTPNTCASLNVNCGLQSNGCGGTLDCGSCNPPATCGGGGPSLCGVPDSGTCTPLTCTGLGFNCGPAGDGCGNTLECGTCSGSQTCGGGGVAGVCGSPSCTPVTCAAQGFNCGPTGDGCGNILDCGTCTAPQVCGGGGAPNVCGSIPCVPTTCAALGLTCGPASDGCGNELQCGTCTAPQACGGGGTPGVCGCTGTCAAVPICPTGMTTTITGNVYDPADLHPLYNVVVYIPNDTSDPALTSPFSAGITCDQCGGATAAGDPLVSTSTAVDGSFTLSNIPVGGGIPLVIQSGRWRREFTVTVTNRCGPNAVSASNTTPSQWLSSGTPAMPSDGHLTMPPNSTLGDIPRIAILSGAFDMVECELRKIGIDDSEFVNPGAWGTGNHVQFYQADMQNNPGDTYYGYPTQWGTGAVINGSTPNQAQLFGSSGGTPNINQYDLVILECEGYEQDQSTAYQNAIATYTNAGGRIFSSDFAYAWLYQNGGFPGVANWDVGQNPSGSQETAYIDMVSNPVGSVFQQWLDQPAVNVPGASAGDFALDPVFHNSNGVAGNTQQWLYWNNGSEQPIHFTFNTPVSTPTNTCGRVTFSDWHTQSGLISRYNPTCSPCWYSGTEYLCCSNYDDWNSYTFPAECEQSGFPAAMTDQETILEFMLFDLTACVPQYQATCVPLNCTEQGISCGPAGDGCGNLIQCGDCTPPATCGGSGVHGVCGTPTCVPATCASQNFNCGEQGDGCGGTLRLRHLHTATGLRRRRYPGPVRRPRLRAEDVHRARDRLRSGGRRLRRRAAVRQLHSARDLRRRRHARRLRVGEARAHPRPARRSASTAARRATAAATSSTCGTCTAPADLRRRRQARRLREPGVHARPRARRSASTAARPATAAATCSQCGTCTAPADLRRRRQARRLRRPRRAPPRPALRWATTAARPATAAAAPSVRHLHGAGDLRRRRPGQPVR